MQNAFFRTPYAPSVPISDYRGAGGLPGLLQQVMLQQGLAPNGVLDGTASPQEAASSGPKRLFDRANDGQATPNPTGLLDEGASAPSQDPNFRQLVSRRRMPNSEFVGNQSLDTPPPPDRVAAVTLPWSELWRRLGNGVQPDSNNPAPSEATPAGPACRLVPGRAITSGSQIWPLPTEASPGNWATWQFLKRYPDILNRILSGTEDDPECAAELKQAREDCAKAFADGWKGLTGSGPYKKTDGTKWDVNDCVRGLVREICGGNPLDRPPPKKVKRYKLR
ncbi:MULTISPECIES: hypothetical protein [unclassified Bradyrhizobium]|uniref:hypothetical protein n=1 Tax=unclassified Bradyrhizobium TaxID=2631580 RepID=UPI0028E36F40|nr:MULTISPECIES: hypothetical protein [unclassified Bradyrhizobium]